MNSELRRVLGGIALVLAVAGCTQPRGTEMRVLSRGEEAELEQRARDLLLVAARSDLDVICCNAIEALVEVAPHEATPLFRQALHAESPLVRFAGYAALGDIRDRASAPAFVAGMKDSDARVRLGAAYAAVRCGDERAGRVLALTLAPRDERDVPDENLRADAALLIGRLGDPKSIHWLRASLNAPATRRSTKIEMSIHGALARLGDKKAADQLIEYVQGRYDRLTRLQALQELSQFALPAAHDALLYRLSSPEEYPEMRLLAARALGRIGAADGLDRAIDALSAPVPSDPNDVSRTARIRVQAALALGDIGDHRALAPLAELAKSQDDERVQVAAAYAICRICARH